MRDKHTHIVLCYYIIIIRIYIQRYTGKGRGIARGKGREEIHGRKGPGIGREETRPSSLLLGNNKDIFKGIVAFCQVCRHACDIYICIYI